MFEMQKTNKYVYRNVHIVLLNKTISFYSIKKLDLTHEIGQISCMHFSSVPHDYAC